VFTDAAPLTPPVEPGTYTATLIAIDFRTVDFGEGPQDRAEWSWQVHDEVDHEGNPLVVRSLSGLAYGNEKANLTLWAQALGWKESSHPSPNDLIGRDAMLNLGLNDKGYLKVASVSPVPKKK
jgi:hypothetical protein